MVEILGVLIPFAFFALIFGIFYVRYTIRNRERLAMIEKGVDASFFETKKGEKKNNGSLVFKLGMFFVGIALGVVAAYLLADLANMHEGAAYPSMIFLFGGLALITVYLLERKHKREEVK
jgi:hypothetical protein